MDYFMIEIEEEVQRVIDEGQKKLMGLEEWRKVCNFYLRVLCVFYVLIVFLIGV